MRRNYRTVLLYFAIVIFVYPSSLHCESRATLAVLDFTFTGLAEAEAILIVDYLNTQITESGNFKVLDRGQRETILAEQEFSLSDCADETCQIEAGKLLSADFIVVGSIGRVGETYLFNIRRVNVATSETVRTASATYDTLDRIIADCKAIAEKITGEESDAEVAALQEVKYLIKVFPGTAVVFFDGKRLGGGPEVSVSALYGKHTIRVENDKYYARKRVVDIGPDSPTTLELRLFKKNALDAILFWTAIGGSAATLGTGTYTYYTYDRYLKSSPEEIPAGYNQANQAFAVLQSVAIGTALTWTSWLVYRLLSRR